jgi:Uma2 family endonuclease
VVFKNGDLRSPDLTFIRNEKIPAGDAQKRFLEVVPDLVVEVLSPSDSMRFVGRRLENFWSAAFQSCGLSIRNSEQ